MRWSCWVVVGLCWWAVNSERSAHVQLQSDDGFEDFGKFLVTRLFINGTDTMMDDCLGVRIAYDKVLTTYDCTDVSTVAFEYVKSHIPTHGRLNTRHNAKRKHKFKERGKNRIRTAKWHVLRIQRFDNSLAVLHLNPDPSMYLTGYDRQAPVFLTTAGVELQENLLLYGWESEATHHTLATLIEGNAERFSVSIEDTRARVVAGNFILGIYRGIPVLVGIVLGPNLTEVIRISAFQASFQKAFERSPNTLSWYYPTAHYDEYIKGDMHHRIYHKWWSATYDSSMQAEQATREQALIHQGTEADPNARVVTGDGYVLEVLDTRHRYGRCLKIYYQAWQRAIVKRKANPAQGFFEWFDYGEGRTLDDDELHCSRGDLEELNVKFCDEMERQAHEVDFVVDHPTGRLKLVYTKTGAVVVAPARYIGKHKIKTNWIFVWDLSRKFYVHRKETGLFHHTSFVAGGPVLTAGAVATDDNGFLVAISNRSGHYKPYAQHLLALKQYLADHYDGVDLDTIRFITRG